MTTSRPALRHLPPRLSMDEYADLVEASIRSADPARLARQKQIEERITARFSLHECTEPELVIETASIGASR